MAINRTNQPIYLRQAYGPGAYAVSGGDVSTFTATGAMPDDAIGATYRVHKFTNIGTQTITFAKAGFIDVFLVAGGAAGGAGYNNCYGGGGGGGGVLLTYNYGVDAQSYSITVPAGGLQSAGMSSINDGGNAIFGSLTAFGGGGGANGVTAPRNGGCGGGAYGQGVANYSTVSGANGITGQGFSGGNQNLNNSGYASGGGGAGGPAFSNPSGVNGPGHGGIGRLVAFENNSATYYSGGGAGGNNQNISAFGGLGGGANAPIANDTAGINASFYGGGGSGSTRSVTSYSGLGGNGFQGLVIIRYRIS